jgi:protoporphyrinogen oxidase
MFSFEEGMGVFPNSLASQLGGSLRLECRVESIERVTDEGDGGVAYAVRYHQNGAASELIARTVVVSTPAHATSRLVKRIDSGLSSFLDAIHYPYVTSVFLGFRQSQVGTSLDGFGFLVPEVESREILGTI